MTVIIRPDHIYRHKAWETSFNNTTPGASGMISDDVQEAIEELNGKLTVSDEPYGASWDNVIDMSPSKNAIYDAIESISGDSGAEVKGVACDTGVQVGDAVYVDTNSILQRTTCTDPDKSKVVGFVIRKTAGTICDIRTIGFLGGYAGMTPGVKIYLAAAAGAITETVPTASGYAIVAVGVAFDSSTLVIRIDNTVMIRA